LGCTSRRAPRNPLLTDIRGLGKGRRPFKTHVEHMEVCGSVGKEPGKKKKKPQAPLPKQKGPQKRRRGGGNKYIPAHKTTSDTCARSSRVTDTERKEKPDRNNWAFLFTYDMPRAWRSRRQFDLTRNQEPGLGKEIHGGRC